jgi:hypothetical protein
MDSSIPLNREPLDHMALGGPTTLKAENSIPHPAARIEKEVFKNYSHPTHNVNIFLSGPTTCNVFRPALSSAREM